MTVDTSTRIAGLRAIEDRVLFDPQVYVLPLARNQPMESSGLRSFGIARDMYSTGVIELASPTLADPITDLFSALTEELLANIQSLVGRLAVQSREMANPRFVGAVIGDQRAIASAATSYTGWDAAAHVPLVPDEET